MDRLQFLSERTSVKFSLKKKQWTFKIRKTLVSGKPNTILNKGFCKKAKMYI